MTENWVIIVALLGVIAVFGVAMMISLNKHEKKMAQVKKKNKKGRQRLPQARTPGRK